MLKRTLCVGICVVLVAQFDSGYNEDWPQLGNDAHHTFFSDTSVSEHLELKWQYHVEQTENHTYELFCRYTSPAVVVARGHILVATSEYCLYCLGPSGSYRIVFVGAIVLTAVVSLGALYCAKKRKNKEHTNGK